jgi:hypothetical protein
MELNPLKINFDVLFLNVDEAHYNSRSNSCLAPEIYGFPLLDGNKSRAASANDDFLLRGTVICETTILLCTVVILWKSYNY